MAKYELSLTVENANLEVTPEGPVTLSVLELVGPRGETGPQGPTGPAGTTQLDGLTDVDTSNASTGNLLRADGDGTFSFVSVSGVSDTLDDVTTRGGTTTNDISVGALTATSLNTHTIPSGTGTLAKTSDIPTDNSQLANGAGYITDYTVTESDVTDHQAALSITESQISDLQSYLTDYTVTESDVTDHQAALSITESQISDLGAYLTAETNDLSSAVVWANVPDANITESSVTQHEGALTLTKSQISDFGGPYLTTESDTLESVTNRNNSTTNDITVGVVTADGLNSLTIPSGTGTIAKVADIPTNNNQIANGAGYITDYTVTEGDVTAHQAALSITESQISDFGTYATLVGGTVPASQLPSYVDDVLEYTNYSSFPATGETGKIYVDLATGDIYRWSGSAYVQISDAVSSADQATQLATARTISLGGDVSGSTSFDGSADVTITATVADDSHNHIISNVDGLQTALDGKLASVDLNYTTAASTGVVTNDAGTNATIPAATTTTAGLLTSSDKTKLDGIEALADVTDATNVAAAGAVMETDTSTVNMSFVVDEDDMTSNSATKVPTQQSVKAYVDANAGGGSGDITSVVAGSGLTGGATTGDATLNVGAGTYITVAADTVAVDATDANTASKVVARDGSGNFSAGTITADLTGDVTGTVSDLSNHNTDNLSEGSTNLYYTDTRANAAIDARVDEAFVNALNVEAASADTLTFTVKNSTGSTLEKGSVVYVSGLNGNTPEVSLARANSSSTMPAFGLVEADIANAADGVVTTFGSLTGLDVADFGETGITFSLGDTVYVSSSEAGKLTNVTPTGETNLIQNVGKIERASPTTSMTIKVGGAGRTNATPNLNDGNFFLGNASNQAVSADFTTSVRGEVSATDAGGDGSFSYNSGTGVFTYTGPSAAETRAHFTGGTGVTITNGEVAIGQAVGTSSNVTFNDVVVANDLTVQGSTTTVDTTNLAVTDSLIELSSGLTAGALNDAGLIIERGTSGDNAFIGWDESADKFTLGTTTATGISTGNLTVTTGTLVADIEGNVTGDVTGTVSDISNHDTDDLAQGSTNLYYSNALVDSHLNQSNPTSGYVLSWNGSDYAWVAQSGGSTVQSEEYPTVTDGSANVTMSSSFTLSQIEVYLNGVKLRPTTEYTVSGTTLTLSSNLSTGDLVTLVVLEAASAFTGTFDGLSNTDVTGRAANEFVRYDGTNYVSSSLTEDSSGNVTVNGDLEATGNVGIGKTPTTELDVNGTIQDAQGNVRALERSAISTTPLAITASDTGKFFTLVSGASAVTFDGDTGGTVGHIVSIFNNTSSAKTISWSNMNSGVFIAGTDTNQGVTGSVSLASRGLVTVINDLQRRLVLNGNVS